MFDLIDAVKHEIKTRVEQDNPKLIAGWAIGAGAFIYGCAHLVHLIFLRSYT